MLFYSLNIVLLPMLHSIFCQQAGKYTDENRPYKFGFNIDGHQHRHEEKDEKGIIKGEYGFITADGYYRVTKYETDENGDFRIISMKNYYVGFPPGNQTTLPPASFPQNIPPQKLKKLNKPKLYPVENGKTSKQNEKTNFNLVLPTTTAVPAISGTKKPTTPVTYKQTTKRPISFQGQAGCSHCIIPTTKSPSTSNPQKYNVDYRVDLNFLEVSSENPEEINKPGRQNKPFFEKSALIKDEPNLKRKENNFNSFNSNTTNREGNNINRPINLKNHISTEKSALIKDQPKKHEENHFSNSRNYTKDNEGKNSSGQVDFKNHTFPKFGKDINVYRLPFDNQTNNNQQQQVDNLPNTINDTSSGKARFPPPNDLEKFKHGPNPNIASKSGFDNTVKSNNTVDAKNGLLYTFNYTVDFHGHHEDGYKNGEKEGDYFVGNKDGVQRKVNYLANEFGYQPNITLSDLNENDKSSINESSEKHTGLKGYEFKWFYRK